MVKIRLKRMGAHKKPFYRVVVADSRSPRDGKFIEEIGYYNPLTEPAEIKIDDEKAQKWLSNGAQATDTVRSLLKKAGIYELMAAKKATKQPTASDVEETAAEVAETTESETTEE